MRSWISRAGGSQLPCCEDTQAALWRGPHEEELRPPAKLQVTQPYHPVEAFLTHRNWEITHTVPLSHEVWREQQITARPLRPSPAHLFDLIPLPFPFCSPAPASLPFPVLGPTSWPETFLPPLSHDLSWLASFILLTLIQTSSSESRRDVHDPHLQNRLLCPEAGPRPTNLSYKSLLYFCVMFTNKLHVYCASYVSPASQLKYKLHQSRNFASSIAVFSAPKVIPGIWLDLGNVC